jgi:hypothetical protein
MTAPVVPQAWVPVEPRSIRKAPWANLPGVVFEGTVLRREGDPPVTTEIKRCGHRHINPGPARRCSEALARKLNKPPTPERTS